MPAIRITNCHIHSFTLRHVPDRFIPGWLQRLLRWAPTRWVILQAARLIAGQTNAERYARYLEIGRNATQREIFEIVRSYYPPETRFVVLPMDMAQMKAGRAPADIRAQHDELARYAHDPELRRTVIPFAAVDPQRGYEAVVEMRRCVEEHLFKGVKLYPPLGYPPSDKILMDEVYPYCQKHGLPVLSHCSRGGVRNRELSADATRAMASPHAMKPVLEAFPDLRVCLAHFGGASDWEDYLHNPMQPTDKRARDENWLASILDMLRSGDYPNLYTDISFTIFNHERNMPALKVFLEDDAVRSRVLFGSDFYMSEGLALRERDLSIRLRAELGAAAFREIAEINPTRFLKGAAAAPAIA